MAMFKPFYDATDNHTENEFDFNHDNMVKCFEDVDLPNSDYGVDKTLNTYYPNKAMLRNLFARHPKWDEKIQAIRLDINYELKIDMRTVEKFCSWVRNWLEKNLLQEQIYYPHFLGGNLDQETAMGFLWENYHEKIELENGEVITAYEAEERGVLYHYAPNIWYNIQYYDSIVQWFNNPNNGVRWTHYFRKYIKTIYLFTSKEVKVEYESNFRFLDLIQNYCERFLSQETVDEINKFMPDLNPQVGQKFGKVIQKWCRKIGIDQVKDMKDVTIHRIKMKKDYGYQYQIALLGDALNPISVPRPTFISLNPIDYLKMSYGYNWNSCHDIRNRSGRGLYCSGVLSYLLDSVSFVFYSLNQEGNKETGYDSESQYEKPYWERKFYRCMFHYANGKLIQGRVYPSSCDSDNGIYEEVRNIVQKVIAECLGENNFWKVYKGLSNIMAHARTVQGSTHYPDYSYGYGGQHSISILKSIYGSENKSEILESKIEIGHAPICPDCGCEHSNEGSPCCEECEDSYDYHCSECNRGFDEGDYGSVFTDDSAFCCEECAENAGWHNVQAYCRYGYWIHDGWMHEDSDNVFQDDKTNEWFYDEYLENGIHTEDDNHYMTYENAEADGYISTEEDGWHPIEDCVEVSRYEYGNLEWHLEINCTHCEECDCWVLDDEYDFDHDCCKECWDNHEEEDDDLVDITEDEEVVDELPMIA